jgi:hypothetical protein
VRSVADSASSHTKPTDAEATPSFASHPLGSSPLRSPQVRYPPPRGFAHESLVGGEWRALTGSARLRRVPTARSPHAHWRSERKLDHCLTL